MRRRGNEIVEISCHYNYIIRLSVLVMVDVSGRQRNNRCKLTVSVLPKIGSFHVIVRERTDFWRRSRLICAFRSNRRPSAGASTVLSVMTY